VDLGEGEEELRRAVLAVVDLELLLRHKLAESLKIEHEEKTFTFN
jgi:hypothetical protein